MEEALVSYLLAQAGLTAVTGTRINWDERPQLEALPSITLTVASRPIDYHHGGRSDLQRVRVQADIWAGTKAQALAISRALTTAVEAMNTTPGGGVLERGFIDNSFDTAPEDLGGGGKVFRRIVDFFVWHTGQ